MDISLSFPELYKLTGEILGEGAYASVQTCINLFTDVECAVKIIDKIPGHARARVFREVETFHHCHGHPNILQLIEFFEDKEKFYLVFEKINGGPLLTRIQENICFSEHDAAQIIKEIASGLNFLHKKGIAHRDLKVIDTHFKIVVRNSYRKLFSFNSQKIFFVLIPIQFVQ